MSIRRFEAFLEIVKGFHFSSGCTKEECESGKMLVQSVDLDQTYAGPIVHAADGRCVSGAVAR